MPQNCTIAVDLGRLGSGLGSWFSVAGVGLHGSARNQRGAVCFGEAMAGVSFERTLPR